MKGMILQFIVVASGVSSFVERKIRWYCSVVYVMGNTDISQGSVATYLRCGVIFRYEFVANLSLSLPVKELWKSVNISGSYGQEFSVLFCFLTHNVERFASLSSTRSPNGLGLVVLVTTAHRYNVDSQHTLHTSATSRTMHGQHCKLVVFVS